MEVRFKKPDLDRLEVDPQFTMGLSASVVKAYRKRLQGIRSALDQRDFQANRSWRFEKLKGSRRHQYSVRLNDQYRLILEFVDAGQSKQIIIVEIVDYH